jgi:sulfotransferase family protein
VGAARPIFIGGHHRSGTSLMRVMLNRHPRIACGPEGKLLRRTSFRELHRDLESAWLPTMARKYGIGTAELDHAMAAFIDNFFTRHQLRQGKLRWAEKTPGNIFHIDYLFRLFPRAQFLHMIRDPRDVYCSVVQKMRSDPEFEPLTAEQTANRWVMAVECGRAWRAHEDRYLEVRYEDLVREPGPSMANVLRFLGEPWDAGVLDPANDGQRASATSNTHRPIFATSIGRWQRELAATDIREIEAIAGGLMWEMGYA